MSQQTVELELTILDQTHRINCPIEHTENLLSACQRLNEQLTHIEKQLLAPSPEKMLILASLNLSLEQINKITQLEEELVASEKKLDMLRVTFKKTLDEFKKQPATDETPSNEPNDTSNLG